MKTLILLATCIAISYCADRKCTAYRHCQDVNDHQIHKNGDAWTSVNRTDSSQTTCAECICMESKEYTVSCVDLEVANKSLLELTRKKMLIQDKAKGFPKDDNNAVHEEIEKSEELAFKVRCGKGVIPNYNPTTEAIVIRHSHYYYTTRIMYCCKEPPVYKYVGKNCKIEFDELCSARVVRKASEDMDCGDFRYW